MNSLPTDAAARKAVPLASGCLDYFPAALAAVAALSWVGNEQHNPGAPLHHARAKSGDEGDALVRHFLERGTVDTDGVRHSAKVAWRALALLQKELEEQEGAPLPRGAREVANVADFVPAIGDGTGESFGKRCADGLRAYTARTAYDAHPGVIDVTLRNFPRTDTGD